MATFEEALPGLQAQGYTNIMDALAAYNAGNAAAYYGTPTPAPAPAPAPATFLQLATPAPASAQQNLIDTPTQAEINSLQNIPSGSPGAVLQGGSAAPQLTPMLSAPANYPVFGPAGPVQTPISTAPAPAPAPAPSLMLTPVSTTGQPIATMPIVSGNAGQYGYQNNAPILNATVAQNLLGNEFSKKIDIGENNELGWGTNSKYQGEILTGAGLYGIRGSSEDIQKILSAGETFKQFQTQGKVITTTDPDTGNIVYRVQTGIDQETGSPIYVNASNLFNTATDEGFNGDQNLSKWQDTVTKLQSAANQLNISASGKTGLQLLNDINAADKRIAVVGRTQYWDPNQTGGIGGQEGAQHAAVVYQQVGDKLIPASPVQTFDFQDPNTSKGFFGDIAGFVGDFISIPPIAMALSAFGAPFIAGQLASLVPALANNPIALDAISKGLVSGVVTGAITGDAEKALIGALVAGGTSYAAGSGAIGDALDKIGLGEYKSTFGLLNTDQVNQVQDVAKTAEYLKSINGNDVAAIQRGLIDYGVDPTLAASAANQIVSGVSTTQLAADLAGFATQPQGLFTGGTGATSGLPVTTTGVGAATGAGAGTTAAATGTTAGAGTTAATGTTAAATGAGLLSTAVNAANTLLGGGNTLQNLLNAGIDYATASKIASDLETQAGEIQEQAVEAGKAAQVSFTPYTLTTGLGTTKISGTTADVKGTEAVTELQKESLARAQQAVEAINPKKTAETLFQQAETLQAPTRAREQEALLSRLGAKGLLGIGRNLPTVGKQVAGVNPYLESLLSAQETARAQQALQAQQLGTQEALRQQQLAAGFQTQAQNIDVQQLNQLLRAQGLSEDQITLALKNAEAQRTSTLEGLKYSTPLLASAANIRSGQTGQVGTQAQNLISNLFNAAVPSLFNPNTISSGLDISGNSQATQNLVNDLQRYGIF